ncbi:MAG TPA: hypothetical protein VFW76_10375 [Ktedonobacterales bacterium]|nr:hypothetical protein [Ktedonobacterales bacterium]
MEKSRQATSGWRRTSFAAFSALFAFILARVVLRRRPALPAGTQRANVTVETVEPIDDALDRQIRLRMSVTMASAPSEFTAKVLTRIASTPAPQRQLAAGPSPRVSWLRSLRILGVTFSAALLLMLGTGIVVTLIDPSLAMAILDALISVAIGLLAFGRMLGQLIGRATATPWVIPAALGALLGCLLLSWAQLTRQFGRDPQEA